MPGSLHPRPCLAKCGCELAGGRMPAFIRRERGRLRSLAILVETPSARAAPQPEQSFARASVQQRVITPEQAPLRPAPEPDPRSQRTGLLIEFKIDHLASVRVPMSGVAFVE